MDQTPKKPLPSRPLWVDLAFSVIDKRQHALYLVAVTFLFGIYCVPWSQLSSADFFQSKLFIADDWSWVAMMIPILIWYVLALRWRDKAGDWS